MSATSPRDPTDDTALTSLDRGWQQLAARGLDREAAGQLGFRVDADGSLVAPVRGGDGVLVGHRRYRSAASGAEPIRTDQEPDFEHGHLVWDHTGGLEARAHVARAPSGSLARIGHDIRCAIVEDEVAAEVVARELGVTAIAPGHEQRLDLEAQAAARRAEGGGVLLTMSRSARTDVDLTWATRLERAATVVRDAGAVALHVRLSPGGTIEDELTARRPLRITTVSIGRIRLGVSRSLPRELLVLLGSVLKTVIRLRLERGVLAHLEDGQASLRTAESMSARYRATLAAAQEVQQLALDLGVHLGLYGGMATDASVGRPVREHTDADFAVVQGGPSDILGFYAALVERGFEPIVHMPARYAHFRRGEATVDIQESASLSNGRALLGRNRLSAFPEECLGPPRALGGHELRTLRSDLLLGLAWEYLFQPRSIFVRTELMACRNTQRDLAALIRCLGATTLSEAASLSGDLRITRFSGDMSVIVPAELRHMAASHAAALARKLVGKRP